MRNENILQADTKKAPEGKPEPISEMSLV